MRCLIALVTCGLLAAVLLGCASTGEPRPVVERIRPRVTGVDLEGLSVAFDVDVRNPLPLLLETPRVRYTLEVAGTAIVYAKDAAGVDLPAGGVGTATIPVRVLYTDFEAILGDLSGRNEVAYTLEGLLAAPVPGRRFVLPFEHAGRLPIVRPPVIAVVEVRAQDAGLGTWRVHVAAEVENPNSFVFGPTDLGYVLEMAGTYLARLNVASQGDVGAGETRRIEFDGDVGASPPLAHLQQLLDEMGVDVIPTGRLETPWGPLRLGR